MAKEPFSKVFRTNLTITVFAVSIVIVLIESIWGFYSITASELAVTYAAIVYGISSSVFLGLLAFMPHLTHLRLRWALVESLALSAITNVIAAPIHKVWYLPPVIQSLLYTQIAFGVFYLALAILLSFPASTKVGSLFYQQDAK